MSYTIDIFAGMHQPGRPLVLSATVLVVFTVAAFAPALRMTAIGAELLTKALIHGTM